MDCGRVMEQPQVLWRSRNSTEAMAYPGEMVVLGNTLFFTADWNHCKRTRIMETDGTENGTVHGQGHLLRH